MLPTRAIDLFLFCFRMKMMITILKNKTRNEVDSGVDLEVVEVVSTEVVVVALEADATRVVVVVLEADATKVVVAALEADAVAAIGVGVGATIMIGVVVEVAVVLEAVVVVVVVVEVVSTAGDLGAETGITTDQENRGETMRVMIEEVLRAVSIKRNLSISQHHPKIKKSLLMIKFNT